MSVLRPVLKDVLRPVLRDVFSGGDSVVQRYFTNLMSSASSRYTNPTATATGDFELSLEMTRPAATSVVFGGGASTRCFVFSDDRVELATTNQAFFIGALQNIDVGELFTLSFARVAGVLTCSVSGVNIGSIVFLDTVIIESLGANQDLDKFYTGILANFNLISGFTQAGNPNAAIDGILYRLDEDFSTTTVARNANSNTGAGDGTAVNIGTDESELFSFDGSVSPNTWTSESGTILPVAGT